MKQIILMLSCALMLIACDDHDSKEDDMIQSTPEISDFIGVWQEPGTGRLLEVTDSTSNLYHHTQQTCVHINQFSNHQQMSQFLTELKFEENGFSTIPLGSVEIERMQFVSKNELPSYCSTAIENEFDPLLIYQHFWYTFSELYPYFEKRAFDWQSKLDAAVGQIHQQTTHQQLFDLMKASLNNLGDGHSFVFLQHDDDSVFYSSDQPKGWYAIAESFAELHQVETDTAFVQIVNAFNHNLLLELQNGELNSSSPLIQWGILSDNIGYLQLNGMEGFSLQETSAEDVLAVQETLNKVIPQLQETDSLIIDLRFNLGGRDSVSLEMAKFFTSKKQLVFKRHKYNNGTPVDERAFYVEPNDSVSYTKPIALITGPDTASAAETFTLAMKSFDHVVHVGENTNGIFSNVLTIPVGDNFTIGLSHEAFFSPDGSNFEVSGIPPQYPEMSANLLIIENSVFPSITLARQILMEAQ